MKKLSALVFGLFLASNAFCATYYVSTTGNDSNTGLGRTDALAWLTFSKACTTVAPGDTVIGLDGTYPNFTCGTTDGTATQRITFKAENAGAVFIEAAHDVIPIGATWTNISGNKWRSATNSVMNGGGGLMRNHTVWFAKSNFSANITAHGSDPWFYYDSTNKRVEINSTTDPSLDEWIVSSTSSGLVLKQDYMTFQGFIFQYNYQAASVGSGNTAGNDANHSRWINCIFRYNGLRGLFFEGAPLANSTDHEIINCQAYVNLEHGFKVGSNVDCTHCMSNLVFRGDVSHNNGYHGFQFSNGGYNITILDSVAYDNGANPCGQTNFAGEGCASFTANFDNGVADNVTWTNLVSYATGTVTYYGTDNTSLTNARHGVAAFNTNNFVADRILSFNNPGDGIYTTNTGSTTYTGNVIKNSVFRDNTGYGIHLDGLDDMKVLNNTSDRNTYGPLYVGSTTSGTIAKNNILISDTGDPVIKIVPPIKLSNVTVPTDASNNSIYGSTSFSVEFLGTLQANGQFISYIVNKKDAGGTTGYSLGVNTDNTVQARIWVGGVEKLTTTSTLVTLASQVHIVMSWTNTQAPKIYINGSEASYSATATATTPGNDSANALNIGSNQATPPAGQWIGPMNRLRIYRNTALTSGNVTTLYGGGTVSGATGEYLFTEGSGSTLGDSSGNGNNGTINAYTTWSGSTLIFGGADTSIQGTYNYNAYYSPDSTPFQYWGTSYNFTNYKSATGFDANGLNSDFRADFTDYSSHNYSITSTSTTLKDAGTNLSADGVNHDFRILGRPQGSAYSIGAYEEGSGLLIQ